MSKQNLYQLFKSVTFEPETKAAIENRFKLKWDKIKEQVNIDVPSATIRPGTPQKGQKSGAGRSGQKENYLAGDDLSNFSMAHRRVVDTNSELVSIIAHVLPRSRSDQVLAPKIVQLIREAFSGKKAISFDELSKLLDTALVRDNGYKQ